MQPNKKEMSSLCAWSVFRIRSLSYSKPTSRILGSTIPRRMQLTIDLTQSQQLGQKVNLKSIQFLKLTITFTRCTEKALLILR